MALSENVFTFIIQRTTESSVCLFLFLTQVLTFWDHHSHLVASYCSLSKINPDRRDTEMKKDTWWIIYLCVHAFSSNYFIILIVWFFNSYGLYFYVSSQKMFSDTYSKSILNKTQIWTIQLIHLCICAYIQVQKKNLEIITS